MSHEVEYVVPDGCFWTGIAAFLVWVLIAAICSLMSKKQESKS